MSSLHCAARVLVARHGEAEYETDLCSDDGGSLTPLGRKQARELGVSLQGERVARVWTSSLSRAVQTAEIVAGVLGVDVVVREGLREYGVGALAETTLVVSHGGAILATLPQLAGEPRSRGVGVSLPNCGVIGLEADADGWRI